MMKKIIISVLVFISLMALILRFSNKAAEFFLGIKQTSGISILSDPSEATVYLDGKEAGKTPFEDKSLAVGDYTFKLEKDNKAWQGKVKLTSGTVTVINRELSQDQTSSAGEVLTLDRGKGLTIISNPTDADVEIDGKLYGKTPLTVNIGAGEHTILISHSNYLKRSIRANLAENFNLTVAVDLALSEADLTAISTSIITQTPEVVVQETPTGFLRVRDKPSLDGKEIAQVKVGDILILLEELSLWDRVRLSDGTEGFVSSIYVEKKTQ